MKYWERKEKLHKYTEGTRRFFPLALEQLDVISRILEKYVPRLRHFLDLGCGDGFLGNFLHGLYPDSMGVFLDVSSEMIDKARAKIDPARSEFIVQDFGERDWHRSLPTGRKFDLVISGYAIHHITNEQKQNLYRDAYNLLNPGGMFLNLEHVASPTARLEELFNDLFLDGMAAYHDQNNDEKPREELKKIYEDPEHKKLNLLASVEEQCRWLREIGFAEVDCYLKIFELALFGGIRDDLPAA